MRETDDGSTLESPVPRGTTALVDYFWTANCDFRLFDLVVDSILTGDFVAHSLRRTIDGEPPAGIRDPDAPRLLAAEDPGPRTRALRQSRQDLLEMFTARAVDNFQVYIVEVLRDVLTAKPEILSARSQEITLGYILSFGTIDELVSDMIEGRVTGLSYQGFGELQSWCERKGLPLLVPEGDQDSVVELIALRNIIVHNRGRVDARYHATTGRDEPPIGKKRRIEVDDFLKGVDLLHRVVNLTDTAISGKFKLNRTKTLRELQRRSAERFPKPASGPQVDENRLDASSSGNESGAS